MLDDVLLKFPRELHEIERICVCPLRMLKNGESVPRAPLGSANAPRMTQWCVNKLTSLTIAYCDTTSR